MKSLIKKRCVRTFFAVIVIVLLGHDGFGQAQSIADGNWNSPSTWDCTCIPTTGAIVIRANHEVTVPSGYSPTAASLTVQNLGTLINMNASATTFSGIPSITFNNGGTYNHAVNPGSGTIPTATWQSGSTCLITGTTMAAPAGLGQAFHHFTYDAPNQSSANVSFGGNLTTVNGNLNILNTGTSNSTNNRQITLGASVAGSNGILNVGGTLTVSNFSRLQFGGSGASYTVTIGDDFHVNALQHIGAPQPINNVVLNVSNQNTSVTVNDDLIIDTDAKFNMITGSGAQTFLNVKGDFLFTNGVFTRDGSVNATATLNFNGNFNIGTGAGLQTYTGGGTFSGIGAINYRIASTAGVDLQTFTLGLNGGFTNDGVVKLGSLNSSGAVIGNINPSPRTFSDYSTIIYNGTAEQSIGSTHPTGTLVTTNIENASNVRLVDNATIGGTLNLTLGDILVDNRRLTLLGTVNAGTHHLVITSSSSLEIGGSGVFGTLPISGGTDINGFTINRTSGSVSIAQALTIQGTLTQTAGDIILQGFPLVLNGPFARTAGTIISNDPASTFTLQGAGAVPTTAAFSGTFSTFDYNRDLTVMGTNTVFTVQDLILRRGTLNNSSDLIIPSGGTIQRFVGEMGSPVDGTGTLFVTYSNQQDIFSGAELTPVTPNRIEDLLVNGSANVFLASAVTISNDLTVSSGGLFGQSSIITLNGNLTIDGLADFAEATIVFDGNTTVSGAAIPQFGTMQVTTGNTLTLPSSSTISVAGDIDFPVTATVNAPNISLNLNGGVPQTITASDFVVNDLSVDKFNDTGVVLAADLNVLGQVAVISPNTEVASNGFLRLVSTSDAGGSGDAWIGQLVDGASVSGVVHVERFMSSEGNIYRYISSPVQGKTVDDLNDYMPVTGTFPGSSVCATCGTLPSMFSYNNLTLTYTAFPTASVDESMETGVGYAAFVFQNALPGPVTIDFEGQINSGDIPLPITFNTGNPTNSWNLVGNPYPATIDWDDETGGWTKGESIDVGVQVHDNGTGGAGVFRYWDGEDGTLTDGLIAKGQAFWMHTNNDVDLTFTINEFAKALPVPGRFLRTGTTNHLVLKLTSSTGVEDQAYVKERANSRMEADRYDIHKMNNERFDLSTYSMAGTKAALAINAVEHIACAERIGIVTQDMTPGEYTLSIERKGTFAQKNWKLFDKFTDTTVDFNEGTYVLSVTSDPASAAVDRFELILDIERPDFGLDVVAATPAVCTDAAVISIPNAQTSFSYELVVNGVPSGKQTQGAADLAIKLDNGLLQNGANEIAVSVIGGCPSNLVKTVSIHKDVIAIPAAISVAQATSVLTSNYTEGNQWSFNGTVIQGATGQTLKAEEDGTYTVSVTSGQCTTTSSVNYAITGLEPTTNVSLAWPNPVAGKLTIDIPSGLSVRALWLQTSTGVITENHPDPSSQVTIDMSQYSPGLYFLVMDTDGGRRVEKIVRN